jgi:hypothetical protein
VTLVFHVEDGSQNGGHLSRLPVASSWAIAGGACTAVWQMPSSHFMDNKLLGRGEWDTTVLSVFRTGFYSFYQWEYGRRKTTVLSVF